MARIPDSFSYGSFIAQKSKSLIISAWVAAVLMILCMPPSLLRTQLCDVGICFYSNEADAWNSFIFTISSGALLSIIFYWLLVAYPDFLKRKRLKAHFHSSFEQFKLKCIENFLCVADGVFEAANLKS